MLRKRRTNAELAAALERLCSEQRSVLEDLRPIRRRERPFETRLQQHLENGYAVLFVKAKPTRTGWPDRTALGYRNIRLVEVKRDGDETIAGAQEIVHSQILELTGRPVVVVHGGMELKVAAERIVRALKGDKICGCTSGKFCAECY